jgi:DNA-binding winged helix-turn-helix (wHTH) protein
VRGENQTVIVASQFDTDIRLAHSIASLNPGKNFDRESLYKLISPYYFERLDLKPMPYEEVKLFTNRLEAQDPRQFDEDDIKYIYQLAGGHPQLTRVAFARLLDRKMQGGFSSQTERRFAFNNVAIELEQETAERLFQKYWDWESLTEDHKEILYRLATDSRLNEDEQTRSETIDLHKWGLIRSQTEKYQLFSDAFISFVREQRRELYKDDPAPLIRQLEQDLARQQLQLFRYLTERANQEVLEKDLRKAVWGDKDRTGQPLKANSRAVDLAIRRLKAKMKAVDADAMIGRIDVIGKGYAYRFQTEHEQLFRVQNRKVEI